MSRSETRAAVASQGQPGPGTRAGQWRRNPALAGLVVLALLLGACGPTAPAPAAKSGAQEPPAPAAPAGPSSAAGAGTTAAAPAPAAAEPRRVRITIPSLSGTAIHYYIARDEGFFARRGIDADISVISAALGLKALVAGEFEFAGAVGTSVSAALTDAPIRIVMINVDRPLTWLYARPGINSLGDLRGKTVAVSALGALDDLNSRTVLRAAAVDADRDVIFLNIGTPDQRLGPLLAGAVDAAVLALPGNVLAKQAGMTELAFYGEPLRGAYAGLSTTTQIIQERRELVRATLAAAMEAVEFYNTQPTDAKGYLQRVLELEPGLVDGVYESVRLGWTADGTMSLEAQRDNIRVMAPSSDADPNTDPSAVFDFSVVREAAAERARR